MKSGAEEVGAHGGSSASPEQFRPPPGPFAEFSQPARRGIFSQIGPAQFGAVVRKAQGLTDAQSALLVDVRPKTIAKYIEKARFRLALDTTQELIWCYYEEYAAELLHPIESPTP